MSPLFKLYFMRQKENLDRFHALGSGDFVVTGTAWELTIQEEDLQIYSRPRIEYEVWKSTYCYRRSHGISISERFESQGQGLESGIWRESGPSSLSRG